MTQETYNPEEWGVASSNKQRLPLADRNNNPGNLKYANQKKASKGEGGFARFDAPVEGFHALQDQVVLDSSRGHTLGSFIKKYAPPSENNTANYLSFMEKELGANADALLSTLGVNKISNAIAKFEGGTKSGKQPGKRETYNPDEWSVKPQDEMEAGTYNPDEWSSEPLGSVGEPDPEPKSTLGVFTEGISRLPKNLAKETIGLFQGAKGASVADQGFLDKWYNKVEAENTALSEEAKAGGGKFIPGVSDEAVSSALSSLPYTGLAMAGATAGAAVTSPIPIPGARVAGGLVGSHLATNRVSAYAAMNRNLKRLNDLNIQTTGEPITIEQENEFKEVYGSEIGKIADWESIPEAAGTVIELVIYGIGSKLPAPMREKAAKLVSSLIKNKIAKGAAVNSTKLLGTLISETAEEVVSGIGGGNVEAGMWGEEQQEWDIPTALKTAKEVAPTVAVTAGLVHGAGTVAGKLSKKEKPEDQTKDKKVFADQLNVLSDGLKKSDNKLADISTTVDLHSNLADDPKKQVAIDKVILEAAGQGLQDGTLTSDNLTEVVQRLPEDDPLRIALTPQVEEKPVPVEPTKPELMPEPEVSGTKTILEQMQEDKSLPEEKKLTGAERRQQRINAAGEIKRPAEVIKDHYPAGKTVTMEEIEGLLKKRKITNEKDKARIEELSKGTLQMPIDIDIKAKTPQDKYKIDKSLNFIDTATEKLGGKLAINIVDKNGRPISPAGVRELSLGEDKPTTQIEGQRNLEAIEKEITDRWKKSRTLPAGKKKSQIANEIAVLNNELATAMKSADKEERGGRVAPERGRKEKIFEPVTSEPKPGEPEKEIPKSPDGRYQISKIQKPNQSGVKGVRYIYPDRNMGILKEEADPQAAFKTLEEAIEGAKKDRKLDDANKLFRDKQDAKDKIEKEKADKIEAEKRDIDGFGDNLSAMRKGKVVKDLNKKVNIDGVPTTLKDLIRKEVAADSALTIPGNILGKPDERGSVIGFDVGKTGGKYAQYLIDRKGKGKTEILPKPVLKKTPEKEETKPKSKIASEMSANEMLAEWDKQAAQIETPTPKDKLSETKAHLAKAADAFKAINDIIGKKGAISNEVDERNWSQIKPLLKVAFDEIIAAGKSGAEFVAIAMKSLSPAGKPYFEKFVKEEIGKEATNVTDNVRGGKPQKTTVKDDTERIGMEGPADVSRVETKEGVVKLPKGDGSTGNVSLQGRKKGKDLVEKSKPSQKPDSAGTKNRNVDKENMGRDAGNVSGFQRSDYIIKPGTLEREGSWKDAATNNLDAIELFKKINKEKRLATLKEQKILAKYVGWGASELANNMFPGYAQHGELLPDWAEIKWLPNIKRLVDLLSPEEIKTAAKSTQYAHYTNEPIIKSIYKALARMGFKGGKILEPGMGIGNFVGLLPAKMRKTSNYTGVEMDSISAGIAKLLYPTQNMLQSDFVKQAFPKNFFDAAIGNPPFGGIKILGDPEYRKHRFSLHNFFFAKTIDRVKPGGLLIFVTSRYTMDAKTDKARQYISDKADLLGAIRLPQTAFLESAGTEVVTDVLFLQKREPEEKKQGEAWSKQKDVSIGNEVSLINEYFVNNPDMVLGEHSLEGKMYGKNQYTVKPIDGEIEDLFEQATKKLPANVYQKVSNKVKEKFKKQSIIERDFDPKNKKEGGIYLKDGSVMKVDFGSGVSVDSLHKGITPKTTGFLKSYIKLRDALKLSHKAQLENGDWEKALITLNKEYDNFVKKHGKIRSFTTTLRKKKNAEGITEKVEYRNYKNQSLVEIDCESSLVLTLENITNNGEITKSNVLKGRTVQKPTTPIIKSVPDAFAVSLDMVGTLDIDHISSLIKKSNKEVVETLGNLIYKAPDGSGYIMSDEYLSGNVVKKLQEAKAAAVLDSAFERNVVALKKTQPEPLSPKQITITPGATWIPIEYYSQFATEILELPNTEVTYQPIDNSWKVLPKEDTRPSWRRRGDRQGYSPQELRDAANEWGTEHRGPNEIFDSILNNRSIRITYTIDIEGGGKKTVFDAEATATANEIVKKIRNRFNSWAWENVDRASDLIDIYNSKINVIKGRKFDGSHLTLPGMSNHFIPYDHQKRVIWRILQSGNTYMAHSVGAGKTFIMISAGMEMRRLGMINKPLYVVPKHMLGQFAQEFQELYPMANILVADEKNFYTENRKRFVAKATLNDPDAVILTHSSFGMLGVKEETLAPVRDEFLEQMRFSLSEMEDDDEPKMKIKRMEKRIEQAEQRFNSLLSDGDNVVSFEELGADFVFVDEAHEFRKLDFATNRQIKGIDSQGSKKAIDLYIKTLWLEKQNRGRSHAFASGTPIVNTLGELYTLQRFFDQGEMEEDGINHFDAWANMFGEPVSDYEMTASGKYEQVERFSKFVNLPELMSRIRMFTDVLTSSQLGTRVNRPKIKNGAAQIVLAPANERLKAYQKDNLQPRIEASRAWKPSQGQPGNPDPIINIITDGKLASIDMRFVDQGAKNDPESKLNIWIDGIIKTYKETKDFVYATEYGTSQKSKIKGGCQICFYNNGFGSGVIKRRGFDSKAFVMQRLKDAGISSRNVGWIDDYKTAPAKQAFLKLVRNGKKRILLGSAKKMGTGINAQNRLTHLHYLDAPWYPADVEQPEGRIIRQGNQNTEVSLYRYATKGSYDATLWQMVARKARFIDQVWVGDKNVRSIEDISEASQYEMAAALASGDKRVVELVGIKADIERFHLLKTAHQDNQTKLASDKRNLEKSISITQGWLEDFGTIEDSLPGFIGAEIDGRVGNETFTERKKFGAALKKQIKQVFVEKNESLSMLGSISGIDINVETIEGVTRQITAPKLDIEISKNDFRRTIDNTFTSQEGWDATDAVGLTKKITNTINDLSSVKSESEEKLDQDKKKIERINKKLGAPFEHAKEFTEKIAEAASLEKELSEEEPVIPETKDIQFETAGTKGRPLTNEDINKAFGKMKNVTTGQDKANNFWFQFKGFPKFTILEVDSINDRVGLTDKKSKKQPKIGAFLRESRQIWFKTGGVGVKADIGTLHHENWHLFKKMGVISRKDLRAVKRAIRHSGNLGIITEETEASWIADAAKSREYARDSAIGRILQKIGDFFDAMVNIVATTSRGVMRKMESGKMVTQDADVGQMSLSPAMAFETQDVDLSEEIEEEDTAFQQAIDLISAHWGKQGKYTNERKKLTFLEHHLGTTMYNAKRIGGWYNRFYNVIRNLGQYKFEQQNRLRGEGDASLFAPLETFSKKNKTEYRKLRKYLVNKDINAEGYKVRPTLETGALSEGAYDIINEKGTVIDTQTTEDEAFNEVWEMEADATDFTDAGKEALLNFRKMTRNLYKHYAKGMNEIIEMARLSGQPPPKVTTIVGGKPVKISLKQAIQDMGDRQGYYFPRIRESGEWKIEGRKEGMPNQMDFFASKALSKGYAQKLRRQGYKVESTHSGAFSEDLFQTLAPLLAQEQVVNSVIDRVSKNEDFDAVYADMFAKQYAEMLKSHGSRARMIGRSDAIGIDVKRGYETDPVKAIAIATEAAAGGYAKQQIAINAMKAITGRDLSWEEYQKDNPGKKHEDYLKDIRKRGADASRQQTEYKEATETLQDILKNQELADRIVGTLKGMAVVWYLGARVSSAAVNLTNMVMGVPATMVGELSDKASKISFRQAFKHIGSAGIAYGKFRTGTLKDIGQSDLFQEIEKRGWDAPQFNMEALNALQNKYGKAWGQVIDKSMWMFGVTEKINRATTIGANYMALCKKNNVRLRDTSGKLHETLLLKARNASDVAHGVYEKGNRPYHMRGEHIGARVLQMTYVFQTFTHNYLQEMIRLGLVKKQYGAAAYMALSGGVIGGLGATVPIGIAKAIAALFDADDPEEEMIKWAEDAFGGGKLARYGLPGLLGISLKGSLATRFDVPETTLDWFGAPGNVVADIWDGTKNLTKGFYREGFEQIAPVAARNISRGLRESREGVTTRSGSPVFFGKDRLKGDTYDMMLRWLSFNPTGISEKREIQWNEYKTMERYKEKRSELYKRYKRFYSKPPGKRNTKDKVDILADIRDFNIEVKRKKISRIVRPITKRSIKQSMRSLKPSKRERER